MKIQLLIIYFTINFDIKNQRKLKRKISVKKTKRVVGKTDLAEIYSDNITDISKINQWLEQFDGDFNWQYKQLQICLEKLDSSQCQKVAKLKFKKEEQDLEKEFISDCSNFNSTNICFLNVIPTKDIVFKANSVIDCTNNKCFDNTDKLMKERPFCKLIREIMESFSLILTKYK